MDRRVVPFVYIPFVIWNRRLSLQFFDYEVWHFVRFYRFGSYIFNLYIRVHKCQLWIYQKDLAFLVVRMPSSFSYRLLFKLFLLRGFVSDQLVMQNDQMGFTRALAPNKIMFRFSAWFGYHSFFSVGQYSVWQPFTLFWLMFNSYIQLDLISFKTMLLLQVLLSLHEQRRPSLNEVCLYLWYETSDIFQSSFANVSFQVLLFVLSTVLNLVQSWLC